jgi:hypothetical protein
MINTAAKLSGINSALMKFRFMPADYAVCRTVRERYAAMTAAAVTADSALKENTAQTAVSVLRVPAEIWNAAKISAAIHAVTAKKEISAIMQASVRSAPVRINHADMTDAELHAASVKAD